MTIFSQVVTASRAVLQRTAYRVSLIPVALTFFALFVAVPTVAIPSNSLAQQWSSYALADYITLSVLSLLAALFILMNIYAYTATRAAAPRIGAVVEASAGGIFGTVASIFGAASCPMCIAALFSFFGFGTVGFLAQHQWWIFSLALLMLFSSLYFASRRVNGLCTRCVTRQDLGPSQQTH